MSAALLVDKEFRPFPREGLRIYQNEVLPGGNMAITWTNVRSREAALGAVVTAQRRAKFGTAAGAIWQDVGTVTTFEYPTLETKDVPGQNRVTVTSREINIGGFVIKIE